MNTTTELRVLSVQFDTELEPWQLEHFRGAIAQKVGLEHEWFHNHDNNAEKQPSYHYRYPLIQYKLHQKRPMLLCLNQGVEEAHHFFSKPDWSLKIGEEVHQMRIHKLQLHNFEMQVLKGPALYRIHNWMALNSENHKAYHNTKGIAKRMQLLERILTTHILRFAEGINWRIEEQIEITITDMMETKRISYKGWKKDCFNLDFECNLFLPDFIGIGQGASLGFGVLKHYR